MDHQRVERARSTKKTGQFSSRKMEECFYRPDGARKKTVFYSLSVEAYSDPEYDAEDKAVLMAFRNRKDLALWLRPHPLYEPNRHWSDAAPSTTEIENSGFLRRRRLGNLDSGYDLDLAIASCDCYYRDYSSVAQFVLRKQENQFLYQDSLVREKEMRYHAGRELFGKMKKKCGLFTEK